MEKSPGHVFVLNSAIGMTEISSGGVSGTLVDPKLVFGIALKACASGIILCHNHPSSNLQPSQADLALTRRLAEAGKLLDLLVLDHIILTKQGYFSFKDEGLL